MNKIWLQVRDDKGEGSTDSNENPAQVHGLRLLQLQDPPPPTLRLYPDHPDVTEVTFLRLSVLGVVLNGQLPQITSNKLLQEIKASSSRKHDSGPFSRSFPGLWGVLPGSNIRSRGRP